MSPQDTHPVERLGQSRVGLALPLQKPCPVGGAFASSCPATALAIAYTPLAFYKGGGILCTLLIILTFSFATAQSWQSATDGTFTVYTAAEADARLLRQVFSILQSARRDLYDWDLTLPDGISLYIHPTLASYTHTTTMPYYVAALANRTENRVDTQRLRVLLERNSLEKTLRHELFHLAQPEAWPRWLAEGAAMMFAGETPTARPLEHLSDEALDRLLAEAADAETLARAAATAFFRARQHLRKE